MIIEKKEILPVTYESKYLCFICLQRARFPLTCQRCNHYICKQHLRSLKNRCPYCRLEPFQYRQEKYLQQLIELDRKKEEEFLISTHQFKCLAEGCDFKGRYHKMDLHRRKFHRGETLREIIFPQERQKCRKLRALQALMKKIQEKQQQSNESYQIAMLLHNKCEKKVLMKQLYEMVEHSKSCPHNDCKRVFAEQTMCFIGNEGKQISGCTQAQRYLSFY